jgi:hypothetical protein
MAKKYYKAPLHQTGTIVTTKTHFGSTGDMVIDNTKYNLNNEPLNIGEDQVICKDDRGFYITNKNRIDSGLADPNRYANSSCRLVLQENVSSS